MNFQNKTIKSFLVLLLLTPTHIMLSQTIEQSKNSMFLELGGQAILYSLNYDRMMSPQLGFKLGISYAIHNTDPENEHYIFLPISANFFKGKTSHKLEVGLGITPTFEKTTGLTGIYLGDGKWQYEDRTNIILLISFFLGYRYQPNKGGFCFRAGLNPLIDFRKNDSQIYPMPTISFGWTFK